MIQDPIEESRIFFEKAKARRDSISQEKKTLLPSINGDERNDKFTTVGGYPLSLLILAGKRVHGRIHVGQPKLIGLNGIVVSIKF